MEYNTNVIRNVNDSKGHSVDNDMVNISPDQKPLQRKRTVKIVLIGVFIVLLSIFLLLMRENKMQSAKAISEQSECLQSLRTALKTRSANTVSSKAEQRMQKDELNAYHELLVNIELNEMDRYSGVDFINKSFNSLIHNYIRVCNLQGFSAKYDDDFFPNLYNSNLWELGNTARLSIINELNNEFNLGLELTTAEVIAATQQVSIVNRTNAQGKYDLYSYNYLPNMLADYLSNKIIVDGQELVYTYDSSERTCKYSFSLPSFSKNEFTSTVDHSSTDEVAVNFNTRNEKVFDAAGHEDISFICTVYSNDGHVLLEYTSDKLTYEYVSRTTSSNSYSSNSTSKYGTYHTQDRSRDAWVCAIKYVEDNLKSPSTAKFCKYTDATIMRVGEDEYIVHGYVDAQNSFGATIRQKWTVSLVLTEKGFKDPYIEFG